jgi:hypothetical protein
VKTKTANFFIFDSPSRIVIDLVFNGYIKNSFRKIYHPASYLFDGSLILNLNLRKISFNY